MVRTSDFSEGRPASQAQGTWTTWPILVGLLVVALVCLWIGLIDLRDDRVGAVFSAVGAGLLVAVVLAGLARHYPPLPVADDSVGSAVKDAIAETFGFLGPAQPEQLRTAVRQLAATPIYLRSLDWKLRFDWGDRTAGVVKLVLTAQCNGHSLQPDGYLPEGDTWVLESTHGFSSSYLRYTLHSPENNIDVDADAAELAQYCHRSGGRVLLDRDRLFATHLGRTGSRRVAYGNSFNRTMSAVMYRRALDHVPLAHANFTILFRLEITGDAVPDLNIVAFHPRGDYQEWRVEGQSATPALYREWRNVNPGEVTIVSWTPRPGVIGTQVASSWIAMFR